MREFLACSGFGLLRCGARIAQLPLRELLLQLLLGIRGLLLALFAEDRRLAITGFLADALLLGFLRASRGLLDLLLLAGNPLDFALDKLALALGDRCDTLGIALDLRTNPRLFALALLAQAILFARDLGKPLVLGNALGVADFRELLIFDPLALSNFNRAETRVACEVCAANLGRVLSGGVPCLNGHLRQRVVNLRQFLDAVALGDPLHNIGGRRGGLNYALLAKQLDHGVVGNRRRQFESDQQRATSHKWRDVRQTLEVRALIFARCVAQMINRHLVMATIDVVHRGAKSKRALLDERILLADGLLDFALKHHAEIVDIDHNPGHTRERFFSERGRALPEQVVRKHDRERIIRLVSLEHGRSKLRLRDSVFLDDGCELRSANGFNLHRVWLSGFPSAESSESAGFMPSRRTTSSDAWRLRVSSRSNSIRGTRPSRVSSITRRRRNPDAARRPESVSEARASGSTETLTRAVERSGVSRTSVIETMPCTRGSLIPRAISACNARRISPAICTGRSDGIAEGPSGPLARDFGANAGRVGLDEREGALESDEREGALESDEREGALESDEREGALESDDRGASDPPDARGVRDAPSGRTFLGPDFRGLES